MLEKGTIVTLQRLHDQRTEMELCMVLRKFLWTKNRVCDFLCLSSDKYNEKM